MQKKYTLLALSFLIFAAIVNMGCTEVNSYEDAIETNIYAQISIDLPNVDTLHFFNQHAQGGNHVLDYYINEKNAFRSFPYVDPIPFGSAVDPFPFGSGLDWGITFDLVKDITTGPTSGMWLPVTKNYFEDARDVNDKFWFRYVFDFNYAEDPFTYPSYLNDRVSAPIKSWDIEFQQDANTGEIQLPSGSSRSQNLDRYIGYDALTKDLNFYEIDIASLENEEPVLFDTQTQPLIGSSGEYSDQIEHYAMPITLTKVDAITFKEHALWSRDGNPFLDKEKTWEIIEIRDSDGTLLNSSGYDCLYDNTFTFSAGNSLKLDIGLVHCASIDQPLLDNGVTEVFQQYTVVTDSITVSPYPYVYITTPGALFAPQRMFMISFDQETAELSTKYGTDSITLKVQAI